MRGLMADLAETHPPGFSNYVRMDTTTFRELTEMVRADLQKSDTRIRCAIFVKFWPFAVTATTGRLLVLLLNSLPLHVRRSNVFNSLLHVFYKNNN